MKTGTVTLPFDMLWVDVNPDSYDADATETAFQDAAGRALYKMGYDMRVVFGNVVSIKVEFDEPALGDSEDAMEISAAISALDVDYIAIDIDEE